MKNIQKYFVAFVCLVFTLFGFSVSFAKADTQSDTEVDTNNTSDDQANEVESVDGDAHRSTVDTLVKKLLDAADKEQSGIGEQVRTVAQEQNDSEDTVAEAIDTVNKRGKVKTFFLGTDYKNLGTLRSEMVKTDNRIAWLTRLLEKAKTTEAKAAIQEQIATLQKEQEKINTFIKTNQDKFSLLGWFVKLFY